MENQVNQTEILPEQEEVRDAPPVPSFSELRELMRRLRRLLTEYAALIGRSVTDDLAKMAVKIPVADVDEFGMDPEVRRRVSPLLNFLYHEYFRVEAEGLENVPDHGRVCLVANHSGVLPYDALMIGQAIHNKRPGGRLVRGLLDDFYMNAFWVSKMFNRLGMVRGCQENADRLLSDEQAIMLFPEGLKGLLKPYKERYQLQRFGRGGFVNLCLRMNTPIVPVAVIGAEELHPVLLEGGWLRKRLRFPLPPLTPTFPLLGPLGFLPLPAKVTLIFGEPIDVKKEFKVKGPDDDLGINHAKEKIRARIQQMLYENLKYRQSIWIG